MCGKYDKKPYPIIQPELNDLVCDVSLTKQQNEILASRLQQLSISDKDAQNAIFRKRSADLNQLFTRDNNLTYSMLLS